MYVYVVMVGILLLYNINKKKPNTTCTRIQIRPNTF